MISVRHRFVFVHIPRTGGNAIQWALRGHSEDRITFNRKQRAHNERVGRVERFGLTNPYIGVRKHAKLSRIRRNWASELLGPFDGYFVFSSVRNPWDRLLSHFMAPCRERSEFDPVEFEAYLRKKAASQFGYVSIKGRFALDTTIRFESIAEQFGEVVRELGVDARLDAINASSTGPYRDYCVSTTRDLVRSRCEPDINLFGYRF